MEHGWQRVPNTNSKAVVLADAAGVLAAGDVEDVVERVFDSPVLADPPHDVLCAAGKAADEVADGALPAGSVVPDVGNPDDRPYAGPG